MMLLFLINHYYIMINRRSMLLLCHSKCQSINLVNIWIQMLAYRQALNSKVEAEDAELSHDIPELCAR